MRFFKRRKTDHDNDREKRKIQDEQIDLAARLSVINQKKQVMIRKGG